VDAKPRKKEKKEKNTESYYREYKNIMTLFITYILIEIEVHS
jgi:hypothetical protein